MSAENLAWMDLEMTGLEPDSERIIEMATIITDSELNIIAEGPVIAVKQSDELLAGMDEWNTTHHNDSGLVARVQASVTSEAEAEQMTLDFLAKYLKPGETPLCGNSIGQDRRFLCRYMPKLESYFHYRNIDVSTIKELARRWNKPVYDGFQKDSKHLALDDIKDSIDELRHYRQAGFIGG